MALYTYWIPFSARLSSHCPKVVIAWPCPLLVPVFIVGVGVGVVGGVGVEGEDRETERKNREER